MYEAIIIIGLLLTTAYFGVKAGKNSKDLDNKEDLIDAITNAKKARDKLSDPDYNEWLLRQRGK